MRNPYEERAEGSGKKDNKVEYSLDKARGMGEKVIRRRAGRDPRRGERAEEISEFPSPGEIRGPSSPIPRASFDINFRPVL
jgi:hypothetical protein